MKKALVVLLALLCLGAAAFADGATMAWSVNAWSGFGFATTPAGTNFEQYNYNWVGQDTVRFGMKYTAADGNAGFNSRLQMSPLSGTNAATFNQLNAWAKFFGGMVTIRGGILDDYTIATKDWYSYGNTDGALGLYVNLNLMPGLDIGVFQPAPAGTASQGTDQLFGPAGGKYNIAGAAFTMPDLVGVQVGVAGDKSVYFGAKVLAIQGVTAILEGKYISASATNVQLLENVGYAMGPLTVGARIGENISGSDLYWGVEPTASYAVMDNVKINVIANVYNNASQAWMSPVDAGVGFVGGNAPDLNYGGGAFITLTQSGATFTIGDYAHMWGGNIFFVNLDLSL